MKKLLFTFLVAICGLVTMNAKAQSNYYYVESLGYQVGTVTWLSTNIGITTSQTTTPGGAAQSWTNTSPGGTYTYPIGVFSYGAYWVTPTILTPFSININSGYTATVKNTGTTSQKVAISVKIATTTGQNIETTSAAVTVAAGATSTISIPANSFTYTSTPPGAANGAIPTLVQLQLYLVN
ncbi:hypothetical protein [Chitinophaga silvisoli]|uniref:Uncharacterized protein n=1 Tax=Chitinophaga silvisoli TaxID=2291814 RepID=A0A3E1NWD9_9BACT|nr:hypothetical protein [Chitinophaga silvisoli]RFM32164.1 hypothetical protein DXN04_25610 [Chitinophaga silvisoli]